MLNEVVVADSAEEAVVVSAEEVVAVVLVAAVEEEEDSEVAEVAVTLHHKAHLNKYRNLQQSPIHVVVNLFSKQSVKLKYVEQYFFYL